MKKKELLKLIEELQIKVALLETKTSLLETKTSFLQPGTVTIPSIWTSDGTCNHEYPSPWMATVPPHCKKCGQQAFIMTLTSSNGDITLKS